MSFGMPPSKSFCDVKRVEIDRDGKIVVIAGKSDAECLSRGDWDDVK